MKVFTPTLIPILMMTLTSFQDGDKTNGESIKTEIKKFDKHIFSLPIVNKH